MKHILGRRVSSTLLCVWFFVIALAADASQKKVLVTGGAGFLGSNLCKRLLELDYQVIALDNLFTGRMDNIEPLFVDSRFSFIKYDVIDPIDIEVDYIFNLACPASPPHYQKDPVFTTKTCVIGALNMLELAKKYNAPILQASTSEVYGDPEVHPQVETYRGLVNPIGIRACYDEGKRCAESLFFDYYRAYGVPIKVIRIFNTYGPNMDPNDGRVVSNFIMQALHGVPITMYGDGTQTRSFCYVDDLIDGMISMMFHSSKDFTGPVNLGNPVEFNLLELVKEVLELTDSSSEVVFKRLPKDDPCRRRPDIALAQSVLAWEPKVSLREGLQKTISYFKSLQEVFSSIYAHGYWGKNEAGEGHSGGGSMVQHCAEYMDFLQGFMKTRNITSVVDAGCGDWEFSQHMNWNGIQYVGFDVVESVIQKNVARYSAPNIKFIHGNFISLDLPKADLLVCKHVLQHLSNDDIQKFIPQLKKYKYCLITNEVHLDNTSLNNLDIVAGHTHAVDLSKSPFNVSGRAIFSYRLPFTGAIHQVFFVDNTNN